MLPNYDKTRRRKIFDTLPKGAYVVKIMGAEIVPNNSGIGKHLAISFDIAEGEYKDFYADQYKANLNENKHWSNDAVYRVNIPYDGCADYVYQNYATFMADLEDSNNGFVCKDEKAMKGKLIGGKFRIEQNEWNGNIYNHTRMAWSCTADAVRQGKAGKMPNDKMYKAETAVEPVNDGFVDIPSGINEDGLPFA